MYNIMRNMEKTHTFWQRLCSKLRVFKNKFSVIGLTITLLTILTACFASSLAPHDPFEMFPQVMNPPSKEFLLGTDNLGRCLFSRIIYGSRVSIGVAFSSVAISLILGTMLGLFAGYYEGIWGGFIMRGMDVILSFPLIILALGMIAALGPSMINLILAIGVVYTPSFVRLVNGSVLSTKQNEYILSAKASGSGDLRIMLTHILPNVVAPIIIQTSLSLSTAILIESALSFLGLGAQPPTPSWGSMISESRVMMELAPWAAIYPGIALSLTVIGFNLFGDGLRDAFDQFLRE